MATVTDNTGSEVSVSNSTSIQIGEDSNVNVFEFGNLILADILPTILWLINYVSDLGGSSVTETDSLGSSVTESDSTISNSEYYDYSGNTYDDNSLTYEGVHIQGVIIDISGS